jgi:hypothetical protein
MHFNGGMPALRGLSTPRAAGLAGVLFAVLFGASLVLIHTALPDGATAGSQWLDTGSLRLRTAATLMPFAGIAFLWFIGVVRDGLGRYEDRFFGSVLLGSGLLFLAMVFTSSAVGAGLVASSRLIDSPAESDVAAFGQMVLLALTKTYGIRMAGVFMMSLGTIWLKTGLMPRWLVLTTYAGAIGLLLATDMSAWVALAFPVWVLIVSLLALVRAGVIDLHHDDDKPAGRDAPG